MDNILESKLKLLNQKPKIQEDDVKCVSSAK